VKEMEYKCGSCREASFLSPSARFCPSCGSTSLILVVKELAEPAQKELSGSTTLLPCRMQVHQWRKRKRIDHGADARRIIFEQDSEEKQERPGSKMARGSQYANPPVHHPRKCPPGLVAFRARILAAVPGKSLNGRIYTRELLKQTAPLYPSAGINPRPFTLDHDIEHCERVVGLITGARYDVEEAMNGDQIEGLWLDAMGYMEEKLFAKVAGTKTVPAFIRGVSIGGEGEGEWTGNGVLIRNFSRRSSP